MYRDELERENANLRKMVGEMRQEREKQILADPARKKKLLVIQAVIHLCASIAIYVCGSAMYCADPHVKDGVELCMAQPFYHLGGTIVVLNVAVAAITWMAKLIP